MSDSKGKFVWYELLTSDTAAASRFYGSVLGWRAQEIPMPDMVYTIFNVGEASVGGALTLPAGAGAPPSWLGYIAVDDVDASTAELTELGGAVHRAPSDIPNVGRFAVVADPQGAAFALFKSSAPPAAPPAAPGTPGHAGWHELHATDGTSAFGFYAKLVGWAKGEAIDMGPMGVYQIFTRAGEMAGGMMTGQGPGPFWLYYFNVDNIDAAAARVETAGGKTVQGPHQVPGGSWIIQCVDPQGAQFALVGPRS
jgi:predicted enzyme related to lactoylglutathione lyase